MDARLTFPPAPAACAALLLLFAAVPAHGQGEYFGEVRKTELFRIPIVVEDFGIELPAGISAIYDSRGERAEDVLAQDLLFTDAFLVMREPAGVGAPLGGRLDIRGLPVDQPIQARVRGRVEPGKGGARFELTLVEESSQAEIISCSYPAIPEGESEPDRWQMHLWADEVTRYLTGSPGCAATRIAFIREIQGGKELFLIDWDGHEEEAVTGFGSVIVAPAWHPAGHRLAFTTYHHGPPNLVALDLGTRRMITLSAGPTPTACAYSPDGRQVAFSTTAGGNAEIYVARADGSQPRRLTFDPGIDTAPSWSPSGDRLVFTSDRSGTPQLYIMDADGSNLVRLTFSGKWNDSPDWSPNGRWIAHVCSIEGKFDLALVGADGLSGGRLTEGGGCEDPRWAPDSRHLVFARQQGGLRNLWILDVDSGELRQLTGSRAQTYNPAWSPPAEQRLRASSATG